MQHTRQFNRELDGEHCEALIALKVRANQGTGKQITLSDRWQNTANRRRLQHLAVTIAFSDNMRQTFRGDAQWNSSTDTYATFDNGSPIQMDLVEEEEEQPEGDKTTDTFLTTIDKKGGRTETIEFPIPELQFKTKGTVDLAGAVTVEGDIPLVGGTEGAWDGFAVGTFEGAFEGDGILNAIGELDADGETAGDGKTEETPTVLGRIPFEVDQSNAMTKWTPRPRFIHIHRLDGEEQSEARFEARPGRAQSELWTEKKDSNMIFIWLMIGPRMIKDNLAIEGVPDMNIIEMDVDQNECTLDRATRDLGWTKAKAIATTGQTVFLETGEHWLNKTDVAWLQIYWSNSSSNLLLVPNEILNYQIAIQEFHRLSFR
jgi:hypothetical protein